MAWLWKTKSELKQINSNLTRQVSTLQNRLTFELGLKSINDSIALYPDWGVIDHINSFISNDQIFSVFTKVAETAATIPLYAYLKKPDEKSINKYYTKTNRQFYTNKAIFDIKLAQLKALEELPEEDKLNKLLNNPNPHLSKYEFFFTAFIYYLLKECFIYKLRLTEGANKGNVHQLYILPPQYVNLLVTKTFPRNIIGYEFVVNGVRVLDFIPLEDMIHIKRINIGFDLNGDDLRGLSIAEVAKKLFTRLEAEDDVAVAQLQNGGLPGVLFDESVLPDQDGQEQLDKKRKTFYDFVNAKENKGAAWMTAGKLGYIATGLKLADMELMALSKQDFKRLCNLLKISDILFNSDVAATESNVKEQIKQMILNACLPLVYIFRDKFNNELVNEFADNKPRFTDCDISEITELQDDMLALANALSAIPGGITLNEIREVLGWDAREEPYMDIPILKQGYTFADEAGFMPPDESVNSVP